jgi:hypothetical protein
MRGGGGACIYLLSAAFWLGKKEQSSIAKIIEEIWILKTPDRTGRFLVLFQDSLLYYAKSSKGDCDGT